MKNRYRPADKESDGEHAYLCGCWIWQGQVDRNGIPIIRTTETCTTAARYYYREEYGDIPDGKVLSKDCGTRLCVRPNHQSPVTPTELRYRTGHSLLHRTVAERAHRLGKLGASHQTIADLFGVSRRTAGRLARGEYWSLREKK